MPWKQLRGASEGLSSADMRQQVLGARDVQRRRFGADGATTTNATMTSKQLRRFCALDAAGEALLKQAMTELSLSARAHDKVLRIARTIADLDGRETIEPQHLAEAVQYRKLDRAR